MKNTILLLTLTLSISLFGRDILFEKKLVKEHHMIEGVDGLLFHSGYFWIAEGASKSVQLYSDSGELVHTYELTHRPGSIAPIDSDRIMVVGHEDHDRASGSAYSILSLSKKQVIKQFKFDVETVVENIAAIGNDWYFTVPNEHTIGILTGNTLKRLDLGTNLLRRLIAAGDNLYFVERGFENGDSIVQYNTKTKAVKRVMEKLQGMPSHLFYIAEKKAVAVTEPFGDRISLFSSVDGSKIQSIKTDGHPRAIANVGHCLAITSEESNTLFFYDLTGGMLNEVGEWSLTSLGSNFTRPNSIAINPETNTVFVRSTNPCFSCTKTQSSTWRLKESSSGVLESCLKSPS